MAVGLFLPRTILKIKKINNIFSLQYPKAVIKLRPLGCVGKILEEG